MRLRTDRWFTVHRIGRPYTTPSSTAEWKRIVPQEVPLTNLHTTQEWIYPSGLLKVFRGLSSFCGDSYPHVVLYKGNYWLVDGHHRVVVELLRGRSKTLARIYREVPDD